MSSQRRTTSADRPRRVPRRSSAPWPDFRDDCVVLLDPHGRPAGVAAKSQVHGTATPLHLGVSCYVVDDGGNVLLTRRAAEKRTFPMVWTNSCCGHPRPEEPAEDAVRRHLAGELGLQVRSLACALPDFTYRAVAADGVVEHEVCPVFVATVDGSIAMNPLEVADARWVSWSELVARAATEPASLSPWAVEQVGRMATLGLEPHALVDRAPNGRASNGRTSNGRTSNGRASNGRASNGRASKGMVQPGVATVDAVPDRVEADAELVEQVLTGFLATAATELQVLDPRATEVVGAIRALVDAGGKRLRPRFVTMGYRAAGHSDVAPAAPAAAAIELLHTFAMLHDDVMDEAAVRRDRPCAHVRFAALHGERGPHAANRFGESAAVLAGDLALVWAHSLLARAPAEPNAIAAAQRVLGKLCGELVVGQYLDMRLTSTSCADEEAAAIALLKSARYTVTRPLELGAVLGGADPATLSRLRTYGDAAGMAFQLRDDVLGVFGDDAVTGKSSADDLRNAKASLLLVRALRLADPSGRAELEELLGDGGMTCAAADRCREIVAASGALASIERLIDAHTATAHRAAAELDPPVADALSGLATTIAERAA